MLPTDEAGTKNCNPSLVQNNGKPELSNAAFESSAVVFFSGINAFQELSRNL